MGWPLCPLCAKKKGEGMPAVGWLPTAWQPASETKQQEEKKGGKKWEGAARAAGFQPTTPLPPQRNKGPFLADKGEGPVVRSLCGLSLHFLPSTAYTQISLLLCAA